MTKKRDAAIDLTSAQFREIGHDMVDRIADLLENMRNRPVIGNKTPGEIKGLLGSGDALPEKGSDPIVLARNGAELLIENSLYNGHPRFFGYITASPAPLGILADFLASAVNPNVGAWQLSPMATEIEIQTVRWIAELLGYPVDCGGLMTSGGNLANFVCFLAARVDAGGDEIRAQGFNSESARKLRVYTSNETHTWIMKAADLFGLGTDSIRWIETDDMQRLDMNSLRSRVEEDRKAGLIPMMVSGTAGTVSTGAIDPLPEIAEFCREQGIWFHVDGAYGGFAAAVDMVDEDIRGLAEADSVAVDPHKWLYAPLEAGCALVRDQAKLRKAFSYHPPYYHFGEETINFFDHGLQNSRGFRALKVWMGLKQVGREGLVGMIEEDIRLTRDMYGALSANEELQTFTCQLSIATFRYVPPELKENINDVEVAEYLNKLNEEVLNRLKTSGEIFVSNAVLNDQFILRVCIVNFRTTYDDVRAVPEIVVRFGRKADGELRPEKLKTGKVSS